MNVIKSIQRLPVSILKMFKVVFGSVSAVKIIASEHSKQALSAMLDLCALAQKTFLQTTIG